MQPILNTILNTIFNSIFNPILNAIFNPINGVLPAYTQDNRLVGNSTPHFGVLCGDSRRSRAASLMESEQGKIALAEYVVSKAEPFKECNHIVA